MATSDDPRGPRDRQPTGRPPRGVRARRTTTRSGTRSGDRAAERQREGGADDQGRRRQVVRRRAAGAREYRQAAEGRLRRYRSATALTVALTGLALVLWGAEPTSGQTAGADTTAVVVQDTVPTDTAADSAANVARSVGEATGTIRQLGRDAYRVLPKLLIAIGVLVAAALVSRLLRGALRRVFASWQRADAIAALSGVLVWLLALGTALAVIAGDARALLGSVGLFGLALSWALQAPIESFTGWMLNSFRSYYRVGDRIAVGEVFGDVFRIDVLTTTVWEAGGPNKAVQGAQPTGALITFPNSEVLRSNIVNFTRDFAFVWDEIVVGVSNDSDLALAMKAVGDVAHETIGAAMADPARTYEAMLQASGFTGEISTEPQLYASPTDSWTDITLRYLVPARERRRWSTDLFLAVSARLTESPYRERVFASYPRMDLKLLNQFGPAPTAPSP